MDRFRLVAFWALATATGVHSLSAQAPEDERSFAPSGQWFVTNDGESCLLARQFGPRADGVTFGLQAFAPGTPYYHVILRGDPLPHREGGAVDLTFRFSPDAETQSSTGVLLGSEPPRVTFPASLEAPSVLEARRKGEPRPMTSDPVREAAIDTMHIGFSRGRAIALQLGAMAAPMNQLRECATSLPEKWGLDPAVQQSLRRPPQPIDQGTWLTSGSYPWEYLRNGLSVRVYLRLMTDSRGGVERCVVQFPKGESIAGTVACREIMKTARFEPALDAEGQPVPSYYATSIFYNTPRSNGPLPGRSRTQGICC